MKQTFHTQVDSFENRQKAWTESIESSKNHVKLGESLQGQGIELIKAIQVLQGDSETAARLLSQAAAAIEKGVKIQRESQREIVMLRETKPRGG